MKEETLKQRFTYYMINILHSLSYKKKYEALILDLDLAKPYPGPGPQLGHHNLLIL